MKVFDLHIGLSDAVIQLHKDPTIKGSLGEVLPNQFDFVRAKGNLEVFCGMICPIQFKKDQIVLAANQMFEIQNHHRFYSNAELQENLKIVRNSEDLNFTSLKVILGLEGVYFVHSEEDIENLYDLMKLGIKIIGLKWNINNKLFTLRNKLTNLGKQFLQLCEKNKIIIDLAHSESDIIEDILNNFTGSVIDSHTCCFSVHSSNRNLKDEFIKEILNRNGLVGINFVGEFVGGNSIKNLISHFEYFMENFGIEGLAIGSDFDGMEDTDLIVNLEDVSKYNFLTKGLKGVGLTREDINSVMYENAFRYFERIL